jgi:hypothetical protein
MTSASLLAAAERLEQELRDLSRYLKNFPGVSVTLNESIDTLSRLRALLGESQTALAQHAIQCPQCQAAALEAASPSSARSQE